MRQNNVESDLKTKHTENRMSQTEITDNPGKTASCVNKTTSYREHIVNTAFASMTDRLCCNAGLACVKRDSEIGC